MYDDNVDLNYQGMWIWYGQVSGPAVSVNVSGGDAAAVTTINVDTGGPITGPTITFTGAVSGFTFSASGSTISLVSPLTTKGDLYTRNSTTGTRLAVGMDGFVLMADASEATGLKWAAASGLATTSYVPVSTGAEPLVILSNGAGAVLLTPYTP